MNNNYNIIRIQQYLNGELGKDEMYRLEREALNDPLLHDAIEGYRLQREVSHKQLSLLQQRLANRIVGQAKERNAFYFGWQRLGVAATACVLMVLVLVLLWMRIHIGQPQTTEKEVQVELATPGNITNIHAVAVDGPGVDAHPVGGWESFNTYLSTDIPDMAVSGEVTLTFKIDANGKPTNIQGVGETDGLLLAEIHRLLQEGPVWRGATGKITVSFE